MRKIFLAAALLVSTSAFGADMPLKAPLPVLQSYQGSQFYALIGMEAETDKATVAGLDGVAFNGYVAAGKVFGGAGYIKGLSGTSWAAAEAWVSATNIGSASGLNPAAPGSVSLRTAGFTERFMYGGSWLNGAINQIMTLIPSLGLPVLPTVPVGAVNPHPYVFAALHQDQVGAQYGLADNKVWRVSTGLGLGVQTLFTPTTAGAAPVTMDMSVEYKLSGTGMTLGAVDTGTVGGATFGGGVLARVVFKR